MNVDTNVMGWHPMLHNQAPATKAISLFSVPRPCSARAWDAPMNKSMMANIRTYLFSEVVP